MGFGMYVRKSNHRNEAEQSTEIINEFPETIVQSNGEKEIIGSINITFINNEPSVRNHIAAIPG